jgi:hypothetical protein
VTACAATPRSIVRKTSGATANEKNAEIPTQAATQTTASPRSLTA